MAEAAGRKGESGVCSPVKLAYLARSFLQLLLFSKTLLLLPSVFERVKEGIIFPGSVGSSRSWG